MKDSELAEQIARLAHAGQVDKLGVAYIEHPREVARRAGRVEHFGLDMDELVAVAWLHDTMEDTAVTEEALTALGFNPRVVAAVVAITRVEGEPPGDYYLRVARNRLARYVKVADIQHNTDPSRINYLDEATQTRLYQKYRRGMSLLVQFTGEIELGIGGGE